MAEVYVRDTRTKQVLEGTRPEEWVALFPDLEVVSDNVAEKGDKAPAGGQPSDNPAAGEKGGK